MKVVFLVLANIQLLQNEITQKKAEHFILNEPDTLISEAEKKSIIGRKGVT